MVALFHVLDEVDDVIVFADVGEDCGDYRVLGLEVVGVMTDVLVLVGAVHSEVVVNQAIVLFGVQEQLVLEGSVVRVEFGVL